MSWVQSKASARRLGLFALLAITAAPATAAVLVVRSSGPSAAQYPPGRSLPDNAQIRLQANDEVVLLSAGGTHSFRGPGSFSPAQAAGPRIANASNSRARVGAVRSAGIDPNMPQPSIWQIDVSQSGTACLTAAAGATLWRPDSGRAARLSIRGPSGSQQVNWPAGQATMAWPARMPLANNTEYQISQAGSPVPTTVRVKLVGAVSGDLTAVAQTLIRNQCTEQLDILVQSAEQP